MRGGGTSQAGQAIGEGIQVDTSKYYNQVLEVNAEERWARVEPGIVLDELNIALRYRYVALETVLEALHSRPTVQHVVITGRGAPATSPPVSL